MSVAVRGVSGLWRRKSVRLLLSLAVVLLLVTAMIAAFGRQLRTNNASDPNSARPDGSGALAVLLRQEGVEITRSHKVRDTIDNLRADSTLVIANGHWLNDESIRKLGAAPHAKVVLLQPNNATLGKFGIQGLTKAVTDSMRLPAHCEDAVAKRAEEVELDYTATTFQLVQPDLSCFRFGEGAGYVRASSLAGSVELISGVHQNRSLAKAGNASFALGALGTQPRLVWLVADQESNDLQVRRRESAKPTLLPTWWQFAVAQAFIGLIAVGIWRGRRLGPIMSEQLPVTVLASETVEGHARLYHRIAARDRAAAALRSGCRRRLSAAYGHREDAEQLAQLIADRTGRDLLQVRQLLSGPVPEDDDQLIQLARDLDRLEQEARQP